MLTAETVPVDMLQTPHALPNRAQGSHSSNWKSYIQLNCQRVQENTTQFKFAGCISVSVTDKIKTAMYFIFKIHPDPLV